MNAGTRILSFIPVMEWTNSEKKLINGYFCSIVSKIKKKKSVESEKNYDENFNKKKIKNLDEN